MKKITIIVMLLFVVSLVNSQIPDSLQTVSDSLQVIPDSLQVPTSKVEKEATYNALKLKQGINDYLKENSLREYDFLGTDDFIISENFHLKTIFSEPAIYKKDGFSYLAPFGSNDLLLQKLAPFQNMNYTNHFYHFSQANYKQPVTLVESFLGLGDEEMNHALASLKKYEFLGIKNLGIRADYLGQEGFWLNSNESSQNFYVSSYYDSKWASLQLFYHKFDEKVAGVKIDSTGSIKWNSEEYGLKLENRIIDLGYRHDDSELSNQSQATDVVLVSKTLALTYNKLNISYEHFWRDEEEFKLYNLSHNLHSKYLNWQNNGYYKSEDEYLYSSFLQNNIWQNLGLAGEYFTSEDANALKKYGAGLSWQAGYLNTYILAGKYSLNEQQIDYVRGKLKLSFAMKPLLIKLHSNWQWLKNETELYPTWQQQSNLGFTYNLPYDNKLNLNVIYQNYIEFEQENGEFLRLKFAIDITNKFTIKAEAINPLNKEQIKWFPLTQTHYIFGVNWFFLN